MCKVLLTQEQVQENYKRHLKNPKEEFWVDFDSPKGFRKISNHGNIKRLEKTITGVSKKGKIYTKTYKELIYSITKNDRNRKYPYITINTNKKKYHYSTHIILAEFFIPNSNNLSMINHKDTDKNNCTINNLEWTTNRLNVIHAYLNNCYPKTHRKKFSKRQILKIRQIYKTGNSSLYKLADQFDSDHRIISRIINYQTYKDVK